MKPIECNEINQVVNELKISFQTCKQIKPSDLVRLVDLVAAVNKCSNGGPSYNTLTTEKHRGPKLITFPVNSFHSMTMNVLRGSVEYHGFDFPRGTSRSIEFTTLNQKEISFKLNDDSEMMIEYITE